MTITAEQQTDILEVVVGLFNAAPGRTYMTELANLYENLGSDAQQLAEFLDDTPVFRDEILAGKVTTEAQVGILMDHFGLEANDDPASAGSQAEAYFTQKLEAGESLGKIVFDAVTYLNGTPAPEFADTKALLDNKVQVAKLYSEDHASTDVDELQSILAGVSAAFPVTEAEAQEYLDSIGQGDNPGSDFALTFGADTFTGGAGDDTFTAGIVNDGAGGLVNSLEDVDILTGGGGKDTLNATLEGGTVAPALNGVEIINIRNVDAAATVNFGDTTGAEEIWNTASAAALTLTYEDAPIAATFGVRNTKSDTAITNFDDVSGDEDNLALAVSGAGSDTDISAVTSGDAASIETMSIAAAGVNFINVSTFTAITDLTVTGAGSVNADVDVTALETVDASGNSGGVTVDLTGAGADLTVTGGSGNDDITAGAGDDTIDVGAGDDRVAFASATLDDLDTATGGEGEDTLAFAAGDDVVDLDADVHTGFEALELGAAAGAVTFDNDDFGFTKVVLAGDVAAVGALTLDNLGDATLEVRASQTNGIVVSSTGTEDTLGVVINADAPVTLASLDVTAVESVNVSTTADTDDTTLTTIETDGVTALTFAGAGDVIINAVTDADTTNDTTTKIASVDLTGQTGAFEMAALGYGTTFKLGNSGDIELAAVAGSRDKFEFTTAFDNEVLISGGEFGGDVSDDKLDLSALGLESIDDLTFTDTGADVEITSDAFEGTIVLAGIADTGSINANDFIL